MALPEHVQEQRNALVEKVIEFWSKSVTVKEVNQETGEEEQ